MDVEALHRNLKRILICLGFPEAETFDMLGSDSFDASSDSARAPPASSLQLPAPPSPQVVRLVTWLEDRKIRGLEVQERDGIRQASSVQEWDNAMQKYMEALDCPFAWSRASIASTVQCLAWLASHAVALDYEDNAETLRDCETTSTAADMEVEEALAPAASTSAFSASLEALAGKLGLARAAGETDQDLLRRTERSVRLLLSPEALGLGALVEGEGEDVGPTRGAVIGADRTEAEARAEALRRTLDSDFPLGFDTGNPRINRAAVVLRMLYLLDLGDLQRDFNALVALGQQYTANPKTNTSMGKVGR